MLRVESYISGEAGPRLLVLGAIHGNEKCGTVAIHKIIEVLNKGDLAISSGTATFVPICNPRAYEADVRFVERNLNRYLQPMETPDCYEAELGNELCPLLQRCDYLLDIHSYTAGGPPFVLTRTNKAELEFARHLGAYPVLTGWADAYAATGRDAVNKNSAEAIGTNEYAHQHGASAVTIECGQHKDPAAPEVAYRAIMNALGYLQMIEGSTATAVAPSSTIVTMTHVFYNEDDGRFTKPWGHMDAVRQGDVIATRANGEKLIAPYNGFIIMPKPNAPLGQEWFYLGAA